MTQEAQYISFERLPDAHPECIASIAVPVRDEAEHIEDALRSFSNQKNLDGTPMARKQFEILLLLNNCTDASASIIQRHCAIATSLVVHMVEWHFPDHAAHVGSARSLLMQQACLRLERRRGIGPRLLLTSDADTCVDKYWIAENLRAVAAGAEAVGGNIVTRAVDRRAMSSRVRLAYALDRRYQQAVYRLSTLLDPNEDDPWPRHHHHFGASLACTVKAYRQCGGMQPVSQMEDLAFYRSLLQSGVRFRHEPRVRVFTSTRTHGRAPVGMSYQLREWEQGNMWKVPSARALERRFRARSILRRCFHDQKDGAEMDLLAEMLTTTVAHIRGVIQDATCMEQAWFRMHGDRRMDEGLPPEQREGTMHKELHALYRLTRLADRSVEVHPCDTLHVDVLQSAATTAC